MILSKCCDFYLNNTKLLITLTFFIKCVHRCWRKLYVKEIFHLQEEYSLIIYNYDFEGIWTKVLQKAIFLVWIL